MPIGNISPVNQAGYMQYTAQVAQVQTENDHSWLDQLNTAMAAGNTTTQNTVNQDVEVPEQYSWIYNNRVSAGYSVDAVPVTDSGVSYAPAVYEQEAISGDAVQALGEDITGADALDAAQDVLARTDIPEAVTRKTAKNDNAALGISDFFQLIAAQLQNQSMYDTVDNTQFIAQLAQFTTLSQITEMTSAANSNLAVSLIGRQVNAATTDMLGRTHIVNGKVERVSYEEGVPYLYVGGGYYTISEILDIG